VLLLVNAVNMTEVKAQAGTGTIMGTVADSSGGTVAGARIDARNEGTGVTFHFPGLRGTGSASLVEKRKCRR
jgi:phage-related minor tail protein